MARLNPSHIPRRRNCKSWFVARRGISKEGEKFISLVEGPFRRKPKSLSESEFLICVQAPPGYHIQRRGFDAGTMLKRPTRTQRKAYLQKIGQKSQFRREE